MDFLVAILTGFVLRGTGGWWVVGGGWVGGGGGGWWVGRGELVEAGGLAKGGGWLAGLSRDHM